MTSDADKDFTLEIIREGSPFLSELLDQNPDYLDWLAAEVSSIRLKTRDGYLNEARAAVRSGSTGQERLLALHRFHRREILRIGARDLSRRVPMRDVTAEISWLADAVIEIAFEEAWQEMTGRFGDVPNRFAIIGLGKLGGEELNFSSDIDIIYVFSDEQYTDFSTRLARRITQILTEHTSEGSFYRVDLRLRPDGARGPVASAIRVLQTYYDSWGETFERLALTKARAVAGHPDTGARFIELIQPFVYRKYLDFAAIDEIRDIKHRIDRQVEKSVGLERHIKLGRGGIREIEFFVQALQVLYGGEIEDIRVRNTLRALERLEDANLIERAVARRLCEAYIFLRDVEHKLQIVHQLQTHELPEDPVELEKCARRMRMTLPAFQSALDAHRETVHQIFQELFAGRTRVEEGGIAGAVHRFVNHNMDPPAAQAWLASLGFEDPVQSHHNLKLLRDAPAFGHSPTRMKNLLENVLTPLIECASELIPPDSVLNRFERLISGVGAREAFFTSLLENPRSIPRLSRLLGLSEYLSEILFAAPEVLDFLIDDARLGRPLRNPPAAEDRRLQEFYVGVQYFFGVVSFRRASRILTRFAEREIRKAFPQHVRVAIFAVGKLGERELGFRSDLDLLPFYEGEYQPSLEIVEEFVRNLSSQFKVDLRLRPEGKKGSLVWGLDKYREYVAGRGKTWERLALTKARFIAGDLSVASRVRQIMEAFVYEQPFGRKEIEEMDAIRGRMEEELARESACEWDLKVGRGGIVDIEFMAEYAQIQQDVRIPNTVVAMKKMQFPPELIRYYEFLRDAEFMVRLRSTLANTRIEKQDCGALSLMLGVEDFETEYKRVTEAVRAYMTSRSPVRML